MGTSSNAWLRTPRVPWQARGRKTFTTCSGVAVDTVVDVCRQLLEGQMRPAATGIQEVCVHFGLPDVTQCAELSATQLADLTAHLMALMWMVRIFMTLFCTEVTSRGRAVFDWSPKFICNRLACPIAQAYLAAQQPPVRPNVRLAFEAFVGRKLRKCSGCEQAWYCSKACHSAAASQTGQNSSRPGREFLPELPAYLLAHGADEPQSGDPIEKNLAQLIARRRQEEGLEALGSQQRETLAHMMLQTVHHVAGELLGEAATCGEREAVWLWGVQLALDAGYEPGVSTMEEVRGFMRMRVEDGMHGLWADMQAGDGEERRPCRSPGISREQYAHEHKEDGNALYGKGDWPGAFICYSRSLDMQPTAVAYANRAAAQLKMQRWAGVVEDCTEALKLDPGMYKALARRCEAFIALADPNAALADLRALYHQRPCVATELEDREVKAVRIRILQILERRQAGQSPQACGYSGDLSYYWCLIGQFPDVQASVKARSLQECLILITVPTHPRWPSTIRALGQATCQVLRTRHYPSLLNRLAVLLEHHDRTGEPLPDGHTRETVTELLEGAATDKACTPFTLLGSSPGFLPWCLTFSLMDTKLKALTEGVMKAEGELLPGHDAWDVILQHKLELSGKWCPCSMMSKFLGCFMARCVGVPGEWLQDPFCIDAAAEQAPLVCVDDRLAVLRRLCELWADPLVHGSCGVPLGGVIGMVCHLFLSGRCDRLRGEPAWDIMLTTPGFLAALAGVADYKRPMYGRMHELLVSLPGARWQRVADEQLVKVFLRMHVVHLEAAPNMDPEKKPWPAAEYERVLQSMDRMLSTAQRRFHVLTQLCSVSPFAGWLAAQAGMAHYTHPQGYSLRADASVENCAQRLSGPARVWLKRKPPGDARKFSIADWAPLLAASTNGT
ncbi:hypothetical protein WJX72_006518 [[Myrmecia] bisecta]|uniref:MYND-type domain-containing protein n=1 Tax=[Myrmecia] bisecta TaxID=41462 RepID=A0AAW1P239_9CHLO